jgi:hypothetical protein
VVGGVYGGYQAYGQPTLKDAALVGLKGSGLLDQIGSALKHLPCNKGIKHSNARSGGYKGGVMPARGKLDSLCI